jgi:ABC-type Fe3+/spermidine/putrescine transport system ATPase subunit
MTMTNPLLALRHINKSFDEEPVLRDISLTIQEGQLVALLGPSGSGKTTLLRIIAGFERVDDGEILFEGEDLSRIPVHERGFGMVFQDYALFPHKEVGENVAFGLRMLGWTRDRIDARVTQMLELVGLQGFRARPVFELSGGEQQRVALARALAPSPRLLLLDEPLGALDRALRERLMNELRDILQEAQTLNDNAVTSIYVTHDQAEAFAVAERVIVMRSGSIEQDDEPVALYKTPRTAFVARFIGMENLVSGRVLKTSPPVVATDLGDLQVARQPDVTAGTSVTLLIRPEAAAIVGAGERPINVLDAQLTSLSFRGRYRRATLTVAGATLVFDFDVDEDLPAEGTSVQIALNPAALVCIEAQDGAR